MMFSRTLLLIHHAIGFSQKPFCIATVARIMRHADAGRKRLSKGMAPYASYHSAEFLHATLGVGGLYSQYQHHEFVTTHTGDIVVLAAAGFEGGC